MREKKTGERRTRRKMKKKGNGERGVEKHTGGKTDNPTRLRQ